jgi:opacity protein-like surface antigen
VSKDDAHIADDFAQDASEFPGHPTVPQGTSPCTIARVGRTLPSGFINLTSPQGLFLPAAAGERFTRRMKKSLLLLLLLPLVAVAGFAQESRQDVSVSGSALFPPFIAGNGAQLHATAGEGFLASYRYLLTPSSGLEINYQYAQEVQHFTNPTNNNTIHNRFMEVSGAYVRSFVFRNWNPFVEGGIGGFMFRPIDDTKTTIQQISSQTAIGGIYGAGIAYELSPSFDIRAEYRGLVMKTPNFGVNNFSTNRYYNISDPVIGIAYHF